MKNYILTKNKLKNFLYCSFVLFLCLSANVGHAQTAASYTFSASSGSFTYLSGGTSVSITSDDATSSAIPIGFTFNYCGTGYTQLKACSNGWLTFNTAVTSTTWTNSTTNLNTIKPGIMPFFDDMYGGVSGAAASYATTGSAGSRVFTFEYKNWDINWSGGSNISIQVKLYEATGAIQYIYKQESGSYYSGGTGTIGIGDGATTPTYLTLNGLGTAPTASSTTFTTSLSGRPATGQIYQFNPPITCSGTPTAGTAAASSTSLCYGAPVTLSLTGASTGAGITYQWQYSSTGTGGWTDITGATSSTYTFTPTVAGYYRCFVNCTPSGLGTYSTNVNLNFANTVNTTTPNARCGIGTTSLAATGSAGSTLKWYSTSAGGTALGSGSPFTTPTISSTTTYYVGAETNASGTGISPTGSTSAVTSDGITPFDLWYTSAHSQYIIEAADLLAAGFGAGNITGLSFNVTSKSSSIPYYGYTIKLAHTTATSLSGLLSPTFTTVYGPSNYNSVLGANNFSFSSSFNWNGSSNILVDVCFNNVTPGAGYDYSDAVSFVSKSYAASYGMYEDVSSMCGATSGGYTNSYNGVPQITFTGNKVCSSPRVAVTATVNTPPAFSITTGQTICNNVIATMSVTSTLSSYNTYVWSPTAGLYADPSCTIAYTGDSRSTVYFKSTTAGQTKYTCTANNTTSLCTATDTSWITNLPSSMTVTAVPANICFSGNTTLKFSPSTALGAAQFQWQTSGDNLSWSDSTGMTGTSLTTATLSNTRYYRVVLKNGTGSFCLNATSDTALVFKPSVVTVTDAARCAPGSVTLGATGNDGTINWFAASSGGSSLGTGGSFTTPSLASTTTYYAEVRATDDQTYTIGTGTVTLGGTGLSPFSQYYESTRTQYLILASDLAASGVTPGQFATMAFNVSSKSSSKTYVGYTVKLANTTATSLSGFLAPTFTTVFGPSSYTSASGSNVFNLSGGFAWDGTSNVLVEICFSNATGAYDGWSADDGVSATTKSYTCTYGTYADNSYFCSGGTGSLVSSTSLPNIVFTRLGCVSSRSPVVATINPLPTPTISPATGPIQICAGNTTTLTGGGGGTYTWSTASGPIAGATSSTYTTGAAGSYRVVVTNPTTGCKDSSALVAVNVNPTPTVSIAPVGTTAICADSSQKFTSVVTGTGLTYKWFNGGTAITGAVSDTLRTSTSGDYTLRVYLGTCSDTSNVATLVVNPLPASSFAKTGSTGAICLGSTLELTALTIPASSTYQWSRDGIDIPGATSQIYNAAIGGIYTVRIKDANNCRKTSDTMKIINTPMGTPKLSPESLRFCEGTIVTLYANAGIYASKYVWYKDAVLLSDTTPTINVNTAGVYNVLVTDVYGCEANSTPSAVTVDPLPIKPAITKTGMILSTAAPYSTYQWYRNGKVIVGETRRNFTMTFDGNYHVVVTNAFGCVNISDVLSVQGLSVKTVTRAEVPIDVYPNPSQDYVNIAAPIQVNLMVRDIQGKQILEMKDAKKVDMSSLADGMYIFIITDKEGAVLKMDKVIKRSN